MVDEDEEGEDRFNYDFDGGERGGASARGDGGRRVRVFPPRALRLRNGSGVALDETSKCEGLWAEHTWGHPSPTP